MAAVLFFAMSFCMAISSMAGSKSFLQTMKIGAASVLDGEAEDEDSREDEKTASADKGTSSDKSDKDKSDKDKSDRENSDNKDNSSQNGKGSSSKKDASDIQSEAYALKTADLNREIAQDDDFFNRESQYLTLKLQDADELEAEEKEKAEKDSRDKDSSADTDGDEDEEERAKEKKPHVPVPEYPEGLVIANVQDAVNVRSEPSEDSDRVGKLYRDCAGETIERKNGWTKLKSGKVTGWTKDEYLFFDQDAIDMARKVGNLVATVQGDGLRVRKEPTEDSGIWGFVSTGEVINAIEVVDDEWVSVEYEGERGYLNGEFVTISFNLDNGETMEQIKSREEKEAAEKKKAEEAKQKSSKSQSQGKSQSQSQNRGAVAVEATDEVLLGALIQCEAGNQPYEGQLAVGAVVMNRVRSGGYPGTVSGVIYASGQFSPAHNGRLSAAVRSGVKDSCMKAARAAIAGQSNVAGATHFRRAGSQPGTVIGDHVFW